MTNLRYSEAPWLTPSSVTAATSMCGGSSPLTGTTASEFEQQITDLQGFLGENWKAGVGKTGNPCTRSRSCW